MSKKEKEKDTVDALAAESAALPTDFAAPAVKGAKKPQFVVICSKLVHGLELELGKEAYTIRGQNSSKMVNNMGYVGDCGLTPMDASLWEALRNKYASLAPIKNGFVFEAKDMPSAEDMSKEVKDMKTGQDQVVLKPDQVFKV